MKAGRPVQSVTSQGRCFSSKNQTIFFQAGSPGQPRAPALKQRCTSLDADCGASLAKFCRIFINCNIKFLTNFIHFPFCEHFPITVRHQDLSRKLQRKNNQIVGRANLQNHPTKYHKLSFHRLLTFINISDHFRQYGYNMHTYAYIYE